MSYSLQEHLLLFNIFSHDELQTVAVRTLIWTVYCLSGDQIKRQDPSMIMFLTND